MSITFFLSRIFGIFPFNGSRLSIKWAIVSVCYQLFYFNVFRSVSYPNRDSTLFDYANILRRVVIVAPALVHLFRLIFIRQFLTSLKPIISSRGPFFFDTVLPVTFFAWKFIYYWTFSFRVRFRQPLVIVYYVITLMTLQYVISIETKTREIVKLRSKIEHYPIAACIQLHRISTAVENIHKLYSPQLLLAMFAFLSNFVTSLFLLEYEQNRDINSGTIIEMVKAFYSELFRVVWERDLCSNKKMVLYLLIQRKVTFSASGFFVLGCPLFTSIIAASTTYLMILLQFSKE